MTNVQLDKVPGEERVVEEESAVNDVEDELPNIEGNATVSSESEKYYSESKTNQLKTEPIVENRNGIELKELPSKSNSEKELIPLSSHKNFNCSNAEMKQVINPTLEDGASYLTLPEAISDTYPTPRNARVKLWVVVVMTFLLSLTLVVAGHLTHSLTLRVEAYHSIYNLGSLGGSLLSMKLCRQPTSLKVTFGWARVDVVSYLISLIFLSSLCFSVVVDAIQTACHIHHQEAMHDPDGIIVVCVAALAVNGMVFALLGGYTQHQGSYLELRRSGEVFVRRQVAGDSLQRGGRTLSARKAPCGGPQGSREGARDVLRDVAGLFIAIIAAAVNILASDSVLSYYVDPALAVLSVVILAWLSYPFGVECSNILLQTIPGSVDVDSLPQRLQAAFPGVEDVHHLHVWSLSPGKVVATVHLLFGSPEQYLSSNEALQEFFKQEGVSLVTLQPEFKPQASPAEKKCCCTDHLLDGDQKECDDDGTLVTPPSCGDHGHGHSHGDHVDGDHDHGHAHGDQDHGHGHAHVDHVHADHAPSCQNGGHSHH